MNEKEITCPKCGSKNIQKNPVYARRIQEYEKAKKNDDGITENYCLNCRHTFN